MQLSKELFDQIKPGEIFRAVTTRVQNVYDPMGTVLTFACIKSRSGYDWAIYASRATGTSLDEIARYGDKVTDKTNILAICPCDEEVLELYEY